MSSMISRIDPKTERIQIVLQRGDPLIKQIADSLAVYRPNYQHEYSVKAGKSDGKERFFRLKNLTNNQVLIETEIGFLDRLRDLGVVFDRDQLFPLFTQEEIMDFLKKVIPELPFKPRKYQLKASINMLMNKRHLSIISTGGGKSLVAYFVLRFLWENKKRSILIVPTIGLVDQMFNDFKDYNAPKDFLDDIQKIGGDYKAKTLKGEVVISTWQSLKNLPRKEINRYHSLLVDEAHKAKADILNDILKTQILHKVGMTGTMPIIDVDAMKIEQNLGKPVLYANARTLIELGLLTKTTVVAVFLEWSRQFTTAGLSYQQEAKLIREAPVRLDWTGKFLKKISKKGITVCTYTTTKFGEDLYEYTAGRKVGKIRNSFEHQKRLGVFFISGKTKSGVRERIREYLNSPESKNEIIIAQTSTFDTGINVPKLKNFVFGESPGKSFTKILQSIGRVMRRSEASGEGVYVWDIVDCFQYKRETYSLQHFWERLQFYEAEGHPVIEKEISLD